MRLIIDIEADGLIDPKNIWLVVCKDIDTGVYYSFKEVTSDEQARKSLQALLAKCSLLVGHNILGYDLPVLQVLCGTQFGIDRTIDTLVVSKIADYGREGGHSLGRYGEEFNFGKIAFTKFDKYSQELETYCIRDVDITEKVYRKYEAYINKYLVPIKTEQEFQFHVVNKLHDNGFAFNAKKAEKLLSSVMEELDALDKEISSAFPPRTVCLKEVHPRVTRHGTLNRSDFRFVKGGDLSEFNGGPFSRLEWKYFNAGSHKQVIEVLNSAGWSPTVKTTTHVDTERELNRLKYRQRDNQLDLIYNSLIMKMEGLRKHGWKVNEQNLSTLPPTAPAPARTLAKRILYESRRRTLTEWLGLAQGSDAVKRIHGSFYGIGAWTQRMAHQAPNTANIPNEFKEDGTKKLLGKELRALWCAPSKRLLVGVDAEGIQLRIFAHYVNDKELTKSLVDGNKADKTDPHSLNQRVLGCKTRQMAKRFLYALLLGGGVGKFSQILECSEEEARSAVDKFNERYPGFADLKQNRFPSDAKRGFFEGLDGRRVLIPGNTVGERKHLAMSGYLQNGEAIVMKLATLRWINKLKDYDAKLVAFIHDEWQTETPNNMETALIVAKMQADSLADVGVELKLNCSLAGSYWNEEKHDYTIGTNWSVTH